ncbi:LOW QUALITY PROTEIN: daf-12-interacting protein 1-like [Acanthaster planci]|uniref:LOW QUALITY PROTEIN: daf-12-interacting protein 1-like n=1 Tax=Acanthaster planci TaxID=133434 RepID=A0A8B7XKF6_ACAPL|nr:LOW QUALITY PROTEIN: daf-12-interacting protein 1-like [Acanthaster planci]
MADFQVPGASDPNPPPHFSQDMQGRYPQHPSEEDVPDYQWPPPDHQWPPGDDTQPDPPEEGFDQHPPPVSPFGGASDQDDHRVPVELPPHEPIDMFQAGPSDRHSRQSPGLDQSNRSAGSRRSQSPGRDDGHPPLYDEGIHGSMQDHHLNESTPQVGPYVPDAESLRITVGNEHYFSARAPLDQKSSALDRLGPVGDRQPLGPHNYGQQQRQSSLEREERYRELPANPGADRIHRSRSSSLEKPRLDPSAPSPRDNGKEKEIDYEHRRSRYDRERDDRREGGERGQYRSRPDDQWKEKERERDRARDADRNWRDEKLKEAARPRDPRRDKDFLAERSKKTPSPLPPSDVPPLYHFLGKNESKKQSSEKDEDKKRSQRPGIPMPTKSRHASSSASSQVNQTKTIESAPDVAEPPKALKSILKKSILKKSILKKVAPEESNAAAGTPIQESPQNTAGRSPATAPHQSPGNVLRQSPVAAQAQPSESPHQERAPEPTRSPVPPQLEPLPVYSQPDLASVTPQLHQQAPLDQQARQLQEPPRSAADIPGAAAPPIDLSAEKISSLLSSLTGLYQRAAPSAPVASQSDSAGYQQQMQVAKQPMQQTVLQPVQQSVPQPAVFSQASSQAPMPQQLYPASSQQIPQDLFQQANPVVSQQMHPLVPQPVTPASMHQFTPVASQQMFPSGTHQVHPVLSLQTHTTVTSQQPYPTVSQQVFTPSTGQSYPVFSQQSTTPSLALDDVTASKIRELAQSLGQTAGTTSSQPSIPKLFPSGDLEARSSHPIQMHAQADIQPQPATRAQEQPQMQHISYTPSKEAGLFGASHSDQSNPYRAESAPQPPELKKQTHTGFVSVDDEDRFLYGDADEEEKSTQQQKAAPAVKPSQPEASAPKVEVPSEDQIKNILSAIGFDFSLAQKIQEQKDQKEQGKGKKASKSKEPKKVPKKDAAHLPSEKLVEPAQTEAAPVIEDNLTGLNKTASFLDEGIKMKTDQELDDFIRDAKKNVSKHKREVSEKRDKTSGSSGSQDCKTAKSEESQEIGKIQTHTGTHRPSTEEKYVTEQAGISAHGYDQYLPHEVPDQQSHEVKYQDSYPMAQPQEGYYQDTQGQQQQQQPRTGAPHQSQQYPPIQQTVQFVNSPHDSMLGANTTRDIPSFQPENIFISVNTAGDSSSGSNRVVMLPKSDPEMDERQRRILEIERRYQQGRDANEVKQIIETEREKERRLRQEAEELIEKEKQRRREERKRKEEEERRRKEDEERKQKEEERRKREEERKRGMKSGRRKEEEERRRKEAQKEKEREFQRLLESDSVDTKELRDKIDSLETELEKLCKKNAEIKRQMYMTSGHRDSLLSDNNAQQDKICDQLRALRRKMNQHREEAQKRRDSGGKEKSHSRSPERRQSRDSSKSSKSERLSRDSKERAAPKEVTKDATRTSSKDRESTKISKEKKPDDRQDVQPKVEKEAESSEKSDKLLRFEFTYYDPGDHWCKLCNVQSATLNDFFIHLHSKMHAKNCDPYDRPWMQETLLKTKKKAANTIDAPIRGTEFMMPVNGFFCRLCKEFFGDGVCATEHLKTSKHNRGYEKFLEENSHYEKRLGIEKAARRAQKLKLAVNQEREQKRKQDAGSDTEEEDEVPLKKTKTEDQDIKMVGTKGQSGFGMFDFSTKSEERCEDMKPKAEDKTKSENQLQSKPEKTPPPPPPVEAKPPKPVPPPAPDVSTAPTAADKKAALAAKIAPMVGKMKGPSSRFLLRKTATPKLPQTSKLVPQNVFPDSSKKSLTFDTLPVVKDKEGSAKENLQAVKMTPSDIANAFKGKSVEEEPQPVKPPTEAKQSAPVPKSDPTVAPKDKPKDWAAHSKQIAHVKQAVTQAKEADMFGPVLPPPKRMSLEEMDEADVCVPGMDDDTPTLEDRLPKPKPPPPVSAASVAPALASMPAFASSTATNLYSIFYKPD